MGKGFNRHFRRLRSRHTGDHVLQRGRECSEYTRKMLGGRLSSYCQTNVVQGKTKACLKNRKVGRRTQKSFTFLFHLNTQVCMFSMVSLCACCRGCAFSMKMGCNNNEELSCGDLYRQYSVMEAGWTVFQCSFSACFSVEEDYCVFTHLCGMCRPSTGEACTASEATSLTVSKHKKTEIPPRSQARRESVSIAKDGSFDNVTVQKNPWLCAGGWAEFTS